MSFIEKAKKLQGKWKNGLPKKEKLENLMIHYVVYYDPFGRAYHKIQDAEQYAAPDIRPEAPNYEWDENTKAWVVKQ